MENVVRMQEPASSRAWQQGTYPARLSSVSGKAPQIGLQRKVVEASRIRPGHFVVQIEHDDRFSLLGRTYDVGNAHQGKGTVLASGEAWTVKLQLPGVLIKHGVSARPPSICAIEMRLLHFEGMELMLVEAPLAAGCFLTRRHAERMPIILEDGQHVHSKDLPTLKQVLEIVGNPPDMRHHLGSTAPKKSADAEGFAQLLAFDLAREAGVGFREAMLARSKLAEALAVIAECGLEVVEMKKRG